MRRVSANWDEWIEEALGTATTEAERVTFEIFPMLTEQGPAMGVFLFAPGPILGTMMQSFTVIPNPAPLPQEAMKTVVQSLLKNLADERTKQTTLPAGPNGTVPPGAGPTLRGL